MTSPARIEANRKNAQKSTGPRSVEGKNISRFNALRHGLRSGEVVLPTEDPAEFDAILAGFMDDWKPPTETRRQLVERAAAGAWRLKRCVRVEAGRLSGRARDALESWDIGRLEAIDAAVARLPIEPLRATRDLRWTRDGIDRLLELWADVRASLTAPGRWSDPRRDHERLLNLRGFALDDPGIADLADASWRLLIANRPDLATDDEESPYDPHLAESVRSTLLDQVDRQVADLRDLRSATPDESTYRLRQAEVAAYAFQPEDLTLQRYEGRLDREFRSNLALLASLTKTGVDAVVEEPEEVAPNEPKPRSADPREPEPIDPEAPAVRSDRDRGGRVWAVSTVAETPPDVPRA